MPGIPRDVAEHSLDIRARARPVKQDLRRFDEEKRRAIGEEIHKLMAAGFIKEAKGVKLNPEKCVFGVPRGMLLGFIVSERGIEANPEKIAAITSMGPIQDLKGVQRVMGCLAALSRFISHLGERGPPLYRLLRKAECFTWTPEAEDALGDLRALLTNAPVLVPPPLLEEQAKIASGQITVPPEAFSRDLHQPSVKIDNTPEPEAPSAQPEVPLAQSEVPTVRPEVPSAPEGEALRVEEERSGVTPNRNWQTPYLQYLHRGELPLDRAKARRLARRAKSFVLLGDGKELHHRSPLRLPPVMHFHRQRPGAPTRGTLGGLRPSRSTPSPCWRRLATRFLMVDGGGRRHSNCPHPRRASVLRKADPPLAEDTRGLHAPLGRAARHRQNSEARNKQTGRQSRRGLHQHLERLTATSPLPLRCFQVVRIPRSHASFSHQGRVSLASAELKGKCAFGSFLSILVIECQLKCLNVNLCHG
jgi:hypothetical protein